MARLLHICASPRSDEESYSRRVAKVFVDAYQQTHAADSIETLDLARVRVPEFGPLALAARHRIMEGGALRPREARTWRAIEDAIARFKRADKLVISSPMWNFGIPYRLKQYFDVIVQPRLTFAYSPESGYTGLVTGRPAMLILARGGEYSEGGPTITWDFQRTYLETILGFIGFTDIRKIIVEPTLQGHELGAQKLAAAQALARELAAQF